MQAHRIPQHVTGFESRILGNFTAKQFVYIAVAIIAAFFIFTALPPTFSTIIITAVVGLFGFVFALANVQGRSMDEWAIHFVNALMSTPQFVWEKREETPRILIPSYSPKIPSKERKKSEGAERKTADFVKFWRAEKETEYSDFERQAINRLNKLEERTFDSARPQRGIPADQETLTRKNKSPRHLRRHQEIT